MKLFNIVAMKRIRGNTLAFIFGLCLTLGLLELGFRSLEPAIFIPPARQDRPVEYYFDNSKQIAEKPPGIFRIVVVGDSFSFGPKMQPGDIFSAQLERFLNLNNLPDEGVEVINLGKPGYSTQQEITVVDKALTLEPDLIILQICLNDPLREANVNTTKILF